MNTLTRLSKKSVAVHFDEFRDWLERDGELEAFRQEFYEEFGEFPK